MDLLSGQAKLRHRAGQVEVRRCVAVEIPAPELGALEGVGDGSLADEGDVARPARVPASRAHQDHERRHLRKGADCGESPGDQDLNRTRHNAGSRETGFASR